MKTNSKYILILISILVAGIFSACNDDDNDSKGTPSVDYVRAIDANKSDSLVVQAYLGSPLAIMGDNLGGVKEIWFNDQQAKLNPVYITNNSILVSVPNTIPVDVTNKIRLITRSGAETTYDFKVDVPAPSLLSLENEYAAEGEINVIKGDYFIEPKVFFNGGKEAEIKKFSMTEITVVVPSGAIPGPITVESMYGSTRSTFSFKDNNSVTPTTHIFIDAESSAWNGWGLSGFGSEGGVQGKYLVLEGQSGSWVWPANPLQLYYINPTRESLIKEGKIEELALRFEVYSHNWQDTPLVIWFSKDENTHNIDGEDPQAHWKPYLKAGSKSNYQTEGWKTITIPLTDFKYNKDESTDGRAISNLNQLVDLHAMFFGNADGAHNIKVWIDNVRLVKYK